MSLIKYILNNFIYQMLGRTVLLSLILMSFNLFGQDLKHSFFIDMGLNHTLKFKELNVCYIQANGTCYLDKYKAKHLLGQNIYFNYAYPINQHWKLIAGIGFSNRSAKLFGNRDTVIKYYLSPEQTNPFILRKIYSLDFQNILSVSCTPYENFSISPFIKYNLIMNEYKKDVTILQNKQKYISKVRRQRLIKGVSFRYKMNYNISLWCAIETEGNLKYFDKLLYYYLLGFAYNFTKKY